MTFSISSNPSPTEISDALNYILSNLQQSLSTNTTTGQVTNTTGGVVSYLYKYLQIKYSDSFDGTLNFSDAPLNRLYYGLRNTNASVESTNPVDYVWYKVTGGFGTTKQMYYLLTGGRQIQLSIGTASPNPSWVLESGPAIDLDGVSSGSGSGNAGGGGGFAFDGEDGQDGMPMQGPQGNPGIAGPQGPSGPAVFLEADYQEAEMFAIPGVAGPAGIQGAQGVAGTSVVGLDGIDGEDGLSIQGPMGLQGLQGLTGATGPQGATGFGIDGSDGEDGQPIQGPMGAQGPVGPVGAGGAKGYWGSFWDTTNQTAASTTATYVIGLNSTDPASNGVGIISGSRITFTNSGTYNVQFSIQFINSGTGTSNDNVDVWFRKNGTDVSSSNSVWSLPKQQGGINGALIAYGNLALVINAGDYVELAWAVSNTTISIQTLAPQISPTVPQTPGVIVTAQQVMYTQIGPIGPQGFDGDQGEDGPMGPVGPQGPQGIQGIQGIQGVGGATNTVFMVGLDGDVGDDGIQGSQGPAGAAGSAGPTGSQGPVGPAVYLEADLIEPDMFLVPGPQGPTGATGGTTTLFVGNYATGSFTIANGQFGHQCNHIQLTTTQRVTVAGTGRLTVTN